MVNYFLRMTSTRSPAQSAPASAKPGDFFVVVIGAARVAAPKPDSAEVPVVTTGARPEARFSELVCAGAGVPAGRAVACPVGCTVPCGMVPTGWVAAGITVLVTWG